jgi:hypothetical protein
MMVNRHTKFAAIAGLILVACAVALSLTWRPSPSYMTVEGYVYSAMDLARGPVSPVPAAVVSNDWDTTTTTTDAAGHFAIRIRRVAADEWIIVRVQASDKAACQKLNGSIPAGYRVSLFLDGGPLGSQECGDIRVGL